MKLTRANVIVNEHYKFLAKLGANSVTEVNGYTVYSRETMESDETGAHLFRGYAVILGSSGAGKTTLLNILGGMDTASEGRVVLDGKEVTALDRKGLTMYRRNDIGFII